MARRARISKATQRLEALQERLTESRGALRDQIETAVVAGDDEAIWTFRQYLSLLQTLVERARALERSARRSLDAVAEALLLEEVDGLEAAHVELIGSTGA